MGLAHSPKIVTNGLVFAYDMANVDKSWKGEPTTNLYDFSFYQQEGGHSAVRTVGTPPNLETAVLDYHTITTTSSWVTEASRLIIWPATSLAASTAFRVSFWARVTSKATTTIKSAFYGNSVNNIHSLTEAWQRFSYTSTTNSLYRGLEFGSNDGAIIFQVAGIQIESKSIQTPYTQSIRSNTQALLDLTGQNTITASSLTYASDGTFSFDGTNSYLDCGSNAIIKPTSAITVSAWIKFTTATADNRILSDWHQAGASGDRWFFYNGTATSVRWYMTTSGQAEGGTASYTFTPNTWINLVGTYDGANQILYVNGTQFSSVPRTGVMYTGAGYTVRVGRQAEAGSSHNGSISNVNIYNRALTDVEVLQNFNALRGRYGI